MGASILFSIADYSNKIDRGRLVLDQDELEEIIGSMRKRPGLEFERTVTEVIEFLSHLEFKHIPHEHAMTNLARWVRKNIANPTANGTEAAIALFEDETNFRGKRVSWSDILGALGGGPIERKKVETKARNFHMTRVE